MAEFLNGHTYAIGLGAGYVAGPSSSTDQALAARGWSLPEAFRAAAISAAGWRPVVVYDGRHAPVKAPQLSAFVAIAGRSGPDVSGFLGDAALAVFGSPQWVLDLGAAPIARQLLEDPAPDSPTHQAVTRGSDVTLEDVRRRGAWGGWIGLALGVGGGVLLARQTAHPIGWGIALGLVGGLVGSATGTLAAVELGALPEGPKA